MPPHRPTHMPRAAPWTFRCLNAEKQIHVFVHNVALMSLSLAIQARSALLALLAAPERSGERHGERRGERHEQPSDERQLER